MSVTITLLLFTNVKNTQLIIYLLVNYESSLFAEILIMMKVGWGN